MTDQPSQDRPNLSARRTAPRPAQDQHKDSADIAQPAQQQEPTSAAPRKLDQLNIQLSDEVSRTLERAKFETRKTKRALTEEAILARWGEYRPKN